MSLHAPTARAHTPTESEMSDVDVTLQTRGRSVSDMMSGMAITRNHSVYSNFESMRESFREEEDAPPEQSEPKESVRMRGSSFAVLDTLAVSRIQMFEQAVADALAKEQATSSQTAMQRKFANRLDKFKRIESGEFALNREAAHKQTLKA